ncbi:Uncharacterised protein r2_g468 [Pycnogonum litorale]
MSHCQLEISVPVFTIGSNISDAHFRYKFLIAILLNLFLYSTVESSYSELTPLKYISELYLLNQYLLILIADERVSKIVSLPIVLFISVAKSSCVNFKTAILE